VKFAENLLPGGALSYAMNASILFAFRPRDSVKDVDGLCRLPG